MNEVVNTIDLVNEHIGQISIKIYEDELVELLDRSAIHYHEVFPLKYNYHQVQTIEQSA
jgi:hypothetical protein